MHTILVVFHVFVAIGLITLVLIQHGKGADAGAAFGSGASSTVFGSQGSASFLTRLTAGFATAFFITSLTLAYFSGQHAKPTKSIVESAVIQQEAAKVNKVSDVPATPSTSRNSELPTLPAPKTDHK
jgi:preprotein translocase subunit SecG